MQQSLLRPRRARSPCSARGRGVARSTGQRPKLAAARGKEHGERGEPSQVAVVRSESRNWLQSKSRCGRMGEWPGGARPRSGELTKYRMVHFATHGTLAGELRGTHEPGLLLIPPETATEDDDGFFSPSEIAA